FFVGGEGMRVFSVTGVETCALLIYPANGAQNLDPGKPFAWNAVSGADGYWLWVGTAPGANDLVNSGQLTATTYLAKNLPPGKTLDRKSVCRGSVWVKVDGVVIVLAA